MKEKRFLFIYLTETEAAAAVGTSSDWCDMSHYI